MKKKLLALGLAITMVAVAVFTGTLAYLTDTDEAVNVATLGNVSIEQLELQRAEGVAHAGTAQLGDLVPYVQGQNLYPAYPKNNAATDYSAEPTDLFYWGPYVTAEGAGNGLWNDDKLVGKLVGAMDKFVFVKNTGKSPAYYRTWIALECPEGMDFSQGSDKELMMNVNGNYRFDWKKVGHEVIDGVRYLIMCATYTEALAPDEISRPSLLQVVLTHNATNEDMALLGDTYEILAFSQACQTENFPDADTALNAAFGDITTTNHPWTEGVTIPVVVSNAEEMKAALTAAGAPKAGNTEIVLAADIDASDIDWAPVYVNGYNGAGVVTFDGQNHTITGLTAPLFKGGFAGKSGVIIKNLTIADSDIVSTSTQGAGAFIECVDSMETIILENCHLLDSSVKGTGDCRVGGLIGWTSGYSNTNDGPVKTYVTIENCSVIGCTLTGTAVGGINGHAGASDWTYTTINNCLVYDNELISIDDGGWRVGEFIGTANSGVVTINSAIVGKNTMKQDNASSQREDGLSTLIGREVFNKTGSVTINGVRVVDEFFAWEGVDYFTEDDTVTATSNGGTTVYRGILSEGNADATNVVIGEGITRLNDRSLCKDVNLKTVTLPSTLTYIDEGVFQQSGFVSIEVPENVTYIGKQAFGACGSLETITIKAKNVTIANYVARACANLKEVYIYSDSVTFESGSMYFTNKENADASAITFYVKDQAIADICYAAFSTSHSYGLLIKSLDGNTTYYNTLK